MDADSMARALPTLPTALPCHLGCPHGISSPDGGGYARLG